MKKNSFEMYHLLKNLHWSSRCLSSLRTILRGATTQNWFLLLMVTKYRSFDPKPLLQVYTNRPLIEARHFMNFTKVSKTIQADLDDSLWLIPFATQGIPTWLLFHFRTNMAQKRGGFFEISLMVAGVSLAFWYIFAGNFQTSEPVCTGFTSVLESAKCKRTCNQNAPKGQSQEFHHTFTAFHIKTLKSADLELVTFYCKFG